VRIILIE